MDIALMGASNPHIIKTIAAINKIKYQYNLIGFIDNDFEKQKKGFFGYEVLGGYEKVPELVQNNVSFLNLIARTTRLRYETTMHLINLGAQLISIIHPTVDMDFVDIGIGCMVEENVSLQAFIKIGDNCSFGPGTIISHEVIVGSHVFFPGNVVIGGRSVIEDGVLFGMNSTVFPNVKIGKWATVGAGAVVRHDVPEYAVVVGNPAKIIKYNETYAEE